MRRRTWLLAGAAASGGVLVGAGVWGGWAALQPLPAGDRLGTGREFEPVDGLVALNGWVRIGSDGRVIVAVPRTEMGQGTHTALAILVAEELDADWAQVEIGPAPIEAIYGNATILTDAAPFPADDDSLVARLARGALLHGGARLALQITGGSSSMRDAWEPMRLAGATARAMLVGAAASKWGVAASECRVAAGVVSHAASGKQAHFGELAAAAASQRPPAEAAIKSPKDFRLIGHNLPRKDLPDKVNGRALFGIDVRPLPIAGKPLLHAAIRHCPVVGGRLKSFDSAAAMSQKGVVGAHAIQERSVVVVADSHWHAQRALDSLDIAWDEGAHAQLSSAQISASLQAALDGPEPGWSFRSEGHAESALAEAESTTRIEARYEVPFLAHMALEPVNCTALLHKGELTLWTGTQVATLARWRAAQLAGLPEDKVHVNVTLLGGSFGRRLELDMIEQAVAIAQKHPGQAVQLLWSREEDMQHDRYRPAAACRFQAALGSDGLPLAWLHQVAAPSLTLDVTARLLPKYAMDSPDKSQIEGAFDLPYAIPNLRVRQLRVPTPVPIGYWRSVGHSHNAFFTESFIDELAHAAKQDPLAYRRRLLQGHARHLAVMELAAARADWGTPLPQGRARGLAVHESFGSWCAQVAEVSLEGGAVRVHRVVCAIDCGLAVQPQNIEAQVQGAIGTGLSAALWGEISFKNGRVQQRNFPSQPVLHMDSMPHVDVHIVPSSEPPGGVGEVGTPPIAPAVANALFALTGQRIRKLPLGLAFVKT